MGKVSRRKASAKARKSNRYIPVDVMHAVHHEAGYRCANPACRQILVLDKHHLTPVECGGKNKAANLLLLCPNCHAAHHRGPITEASLRTWKMTLVALNEAFDRRTIDILLMLTKTGVLNQMRMEAVTDFAALIASDMVEFQPQRIGHFEGMPGFSIKLSERGRLFVDAWKAGDQEAILAGLPAPARPSL